MSKGYFHSISIPNNCHVPASISCCYYPEVSSILMVRWSQIINGEIIKTISAEAFQKRQAWAWQTFGLETRMKN